MLASENQGLEDDKHVLLGGKRHIFKGFKGVSFMLNLETTKKTIDKPRAFAEKISQNSLLNGTKGIFTYTNLPTFMVN